MQMDTNLKEESRVTDPLHPVNALGQKSHLSPGLKRSNGGFTGIINKP